MNWVWGKGDFLLIFGIPGYNFVAWFLLIFLFAIFWEQLPGIVAKYGQRPAMTVFLSVCTVGSVVVAGMIFVLWFGLAGALFSLAGISPVQIPAGW